MSLSQAVSNPDTAGFVLAGGRSSRMGQDKAFLELDGRPLIRHALDLLASAGLSATVAGARSDLSRFAPVLEDSGEGPLSGICSALAATSAQLAIFVPVDMPLLPAELLEALIRQARIIGALVTVSSINGYAETFPAVVHHSALPALERELASGRRGCFTAFEAAVRHAGQAISIVPVEFLVQAGLVAHPMDLPAAFWFLNANTPTDLAEVQVLLSVPHRVI